MNICTSSMRIIACQNPQCSLNKVLKANFSSSKNARALHLSRENKIQRISINPYNSRPRLTAHAASTESDISQKEFDQLLQWCIEQHALPPPALEPATLDSIIDQKQIPGFIVNRQVSKDDILLEIPGDLAITSVDVQKDPHLSQLAQDRSELVGLALFLMKERSKTASSWSYFLNTLPPATNSPILWPDEERSLLLRGSPVLQQSRDREAALIQEWIEINTLITSLNDANSYPSTIYNQQNFLNAMSIIFAYAIYLPSAQCFALLPLLSAVPKTGSTSGALVDYDLDRESVTVRASRQFSRGQEIKIFDGRPNGELFLATGTLEPTNPSDFLTLPASLVAADRLYQMKKQVLEEFGFTISAEFPIYEDKLALQHLAYLRLARLTDAAQFAKVTFEADVIISPENEYEVLQLVMGDLRELLQGYGGGYEEDIKELQQRDLSVRQRLAALLRASEKRILRGTMDGVRRRLAPIRGIPTKDGSLADPNADFKEMFDVLESLPSAPKKLFDGLAAWARGDQDPDWDKKKNSGGTKR